MLRQSKTLLMTILLTSISITGFAKTVAQDNVIDDEGIEVSSSMQSTREEIAAIQVLSEICPKIIGKNKNFDSGYQRLLKDFMPGFENPSLAVRALNEEDDYQTILKQAREDAAKASQEDNREICLGVIDWGKT